MLSLNIKVSLSALQKRSLQMVEGPRSCGHTNRERQKVNASTLCYRFSLPLVWRDTYFQHRKLQDLGLISDMAAQRAALDLTVSVKSLEGISPCMGIPARQLSIFWQPRPLLKTVAAFSKVAKHSPNMSPVNSWARRIHVFFPICNLSCVMESDSERNTNSV